MKSWNIFHKTKIYSGIYVDKLKENDEIYVDYDNKRFTYKITRKYQVDRYAISIESPSTEAKMTLYSCDLRGEQAGREVIEAKLMNF